MSKHILDRPHAAAPTRAARYLEAERREALHPATRDLIRRPRPEGAERQQHFLRIERQGEGKV